jgi:hypothetical protein
MATSLPNTNINIPYSEFLNATTGRPNQEWLLWLMNPTFITANLGTALAVTSGGTGLTTIPTNGQLLIGNGTGYTLNTLGAGSGISVTNGLGTISVANTGVLSFSGGATGLTPATPTTGAVVLAGTLDVNNGGTGQISYTDGQLLIGNTTGNTLAKSTLTAGAGITVTNGAGAVTIASSATSAPVTKTADFTLAATENWVINNKTGSTCTVTLPAASSWTGRAVTFHNYQAQTLVSASSNVVPQGGGAAGTAILLGVVGNWATMLSDGTNWVIMQAAANNCLLLE